MKKLYFNTIPYYSMEFPKLKLHASNFVVYRIWFNNHYYIGVTSNLSQRLYSHFGVIKRYLQNKTVSKCERRSYKKIFNYIKNSDNIEISYDILYETNDKQNAYSKEWDIQYSLQDDDLHLWVNILRNKNKPSKYKISS